MLVLFRCRCFSGSGYWFYEGFVAFLVPDIGFMKVSLLFFLVPDIGFMRVSLLSGPHVGFTKVSLLFCPRPAHIFKNTGSKIKD